MGWLKLHFFAGIKLKQEWLDDSSKIADKGGSGDSMKIGMRPFDWAQDRHEATGYSN